MAPWPTGTTRLFALLGHPVARSASPAMHNAALRRRGVDAVYLALDVDPTRADQVADAMRTLGLSGANLTVPLKEAVLPHLDRLAPSAAQAGAANTVLNHGGVLVGHNTDGAGLLAHLAHLGVAPARRAIVLGAGGSGRAVAAALAQNGAQVLILNRNPARAQAAVAALQAQGLVGLSAGPLDAEAFATAAPRCDLVVHCTPGASAGVLALDPRLPEGASWVDLNYWDPNPPHREALVRAGRRFVPGWGMLAFQGAAALSLFIGEHVPGAELLADLPEGVQ